VDYVGGFPVVLRYAGQSTGLGIVRVDTLQGLCSLVEHSHSTGRYPELVEFIPEATPWRVAVVGGKVSGWCRGLNPESDFRSVSSDDSADYSAPLPDGCGDLAVRACAAVESGAAGVDILQANDGSLCLLEANFPFYFGHLDQHGHDVAGAIVDALLAIRERRSYSSHGD
jgi:glutathione synthase/RimK-type ligase-like ATP-grasp enzyme